MHNRGTCACLLHLDCGREFPKFPPNARDFVLCVSHYGLDCNPIARQRTFDQSELNSKRYFQIIFLFQSVFWIVIPLKYYREKKYHELN